MRNLFTSRYGNFNIINLLPSLIFFALCLLCFTASASTKTSHTKTPAFNQHTEVQQFIHMMVTKHGFKQQDLEKLFANIHPNASVIATMNKPYEAKPWYIYKKNFLSQQRIQNGVNFWQQHQKALDRAQKEFGVSPSIIVAIIGVESEYGKRKGGYSVLQSLTTLAFQYPRRKEFFQYELEQFLLLCRQEKLDPSKIYGSYAGAIGIPQFMPSSYRRFAVDFAGKGVANLNNTDDVIGSIANFLHHYGWVAGETVAQPAKVSGTDYQQLAYHKRNAQYSAAELNKKNIHDKKHYPQGLKANLIQLQSANGAEYWLGFNNFYAITHYNPSNSYAMAVFQLSQAIEKLKTSEEIAKKEITKKKA